MASRALWRADKAFPNFYLRLWANARKTLKYSLKAWKLNIAKDCLSKQAWDGIYTSAILQVNQTQADQNLSTDHNHGVSFQTTTGNHASANELSQIDEMVHFDDGIDPGHSASDAENICSLQRLHLEFLNMTLERYSLNRKSKDLKFQLVLGDPTQLQLNGTCKVIVDGRQADSCGDT